jgi:hypothetical protein
MGDPRAHLRHDHRPQAPEEHRYGRLVEFWSAISAGLLVIVVAGMLFVGILPIWATLLVAIVGYVVIEAAFRRRLIALALTATLAMAVVGAFVLIVTHLPLVIVAVVALVALLAIVDNIRELRS